LPLKLPDYPKFNKPTFSGCCCNQFVLRVWRAEQTPLAGFTERLKILHTISKLLLTAPLGLYVSEDGIVCDDWIQSKIVVT
jgi:hypothetical protein